ncbi:DUF747-domain-containing protein [Delitschia confertaspora ATCC 74209]|uniref:DUF747-domain-containing protein n=1 Tax=Delitschia confertaspora ATCC 74209 TaxID=1513339 RepID=A0A9P4MRX5_9PLEO|nr:DUF747-domain-containing protein [Delitschia confertaspora ATCC 74209]
MSATHDETNNNDKSTKYENGNTTIYKENIGYDGLVRTGASNSNSTRHSSSQTTSRRPSAFPHRPSAPDEAVLSDSFLSRPSKTQIKRPGDSMRRRSSAGFTTAGVVEDSVHDKADLGVLKLSPREVFDLANEPANLPVRRASLILEDSIVEAVEQDEETRKEGELTANADIGKITSPVKRLGSPIKAEKDFVSLRNPSGELKQSSRPGLSSRAISTPVIRRKPSSSRTPSYGPESEHRSGRPVPPPLDLNFKDGTGASGLKPSREPDPRDIPSPMPSSMPLPPMSMPTFLSLELSADRPSPLYIYRSATNDFPYESSQIKYERLVNFLFLPPQLERILGFGTLVCLDAWMYILTILPLRFLVALWILVKWWAGLVVKEFKDLGSFVWVGLGRVWRRRRRNTEPVVLETKGEEEKPRSRRPSVSAVTSPNPVGNSNVRENGAVTSSVPESQMKKYPRSSRYRHRRTKSTPSALLPSHKADLLNGLLVIMSCAILMRFDASRMYHGIRGQAAIKLYVIYNVLEVCDRLFSALGQDVLECLFSRETLDRNPNGRSKLLRPFWMFVLALVYNVLHATALFYQVITLNVAVNSYSNALLTLLMSNQFVEIKGTVFKKFEKDNLFQLTCADIVERFQLWLMLLIIAMRNIVEVGGLSIRSASSSSPSFSNLANATAPAAASSNIIPLSFTYIFPKWTGQVLNPFLLVLGSEMLVDWLKHAYITKFNSCRPEIYGRFLDVLAKDYYSNAFHDQNLNKRLGLPVLPLACLFIRAAIQTYHMFIATHMPPPLPSTATGLTTASAATSSPATTAALAHIDALFRRALGRSTFLGSSGTSPLSFSNLLNYQYWASLPSTLTANFDPLITLATTVSIILGTYLFLLAFKLLLGMLLLKASRERYRGMKEREKMVFETGGKRVGGWGVVECQDEKRRWIYEGDEAGLRRIREREERAKRAAEREGRGEGGNSKGDGLERVVRYDMVAKRIW